MAPDIESVAKQVFIALADPTRRTILAALATDGPSTATDLAARLPITRQAVAKHLALMADAGLVTPEPGERATGCAPHQCNSPNSFSPRSRTPGTTVSTPRSTISRRNDRAEAAARGRRAATGSPSPAAAGIDGCCASTAAAALQGRRQQSIELPRPR
jgi:hypothetical protein